jgi:hypothetical protein
MMTNEVLEQRLADRLAQLRSNDEAFASVAMSLITVRREIREAGAVAAPPAVPGTCACPRFVDTGGVRIADLDCPVHGVGGTEPGDGQWPEARHIVIESRKLTLPEPQITATQVRDYVKAPHNDRVFRERPSDMGDEELFDGTVYDVSEGDRFWTLPRGARFPSGGV